MTYISGFSGCLVYTNLSFTDTKFVSVILKKKRNNGFRFYFSCISSQTIFPYSAIPKSALTRPRTEETWRHGRHHHIKAPGNCILAVVPDNCRLLSLHNSPKPELGLTFKQQVSLTFWKFSYTSRKDLHQSPFSLAERNLKRIFTFIFLKKKVKIAFSVCFAASHYAGGVHKHFYWVPHSAPQQQAAAAESCVCEHLHFISIHFVQPLYHFSLRKVS